MQELGSLSAAFSILYPVTRGQAAVAVPTLCCLLLCCKPTTDSWIEACPVSTDLCDNVAHSCVISIASYLVSTASFFFACWKKKLAVETGYEAIISPP